MNNFKTIILLLSLACLLFCSGCQTEEEREISRMTKPIVVAAISEKGDVVLRDLEGAVLLIPGHYYFARAVAGSYQVGDTFIPQQEDCLP